MTADARQRRRGMRIDRALALCAAALLVVFVNLLAERFFLRADVSRGRYYELGERTRETLHAVTGRVDAAVLFSRDHPISEHLGNLLREYRALAPELRVEWVDPERDISRAEEIAEKYGIDRSGVVVLSSGERHRVVDREDLAVYDYSGVRRGGEPQLKAFTGERAVTSALAHLQTTEKPVVCVLQGHGERDFRDFDRRSGYSTVARIMRRDNMKLRPLTFGRENRVPEECAVLLVPGPTRRLSDAEIERISDYLEDGGRMFLLLDALVETGLAPLMERWGIELRHDVVMDPSRSLEGRGILLSNYADHPVTAARRGYSALFFRPRSVRPTLVARMLDSPDRPRVTPLFTCSKNGWAEAQPESSPASYDPDTPDLKGPVPVAAAVEKGGGGGLDVQIRPTRIVVYGDADFISNAAITGGDRDLFMGAMHWLLDRETPVDVPPRALRRVRLSMGGHARQVWFWGAVAGGPALAALLGLAVAWRRRV
ncbi:GldG family protein [Kiritimatiella glycovorans]|uniref:Gliding-associated putative ABC transporter substrate-binding component GldG n=1 Tax=Kiritimatiella glycovorans TaxID=1307763 RepID=A0A0G3EB62_9BACT|nr:GldG family protein [Kiritimatiella glycovorans]AKJ63528.1 gliding-associated putative ABC transporter substrate-binding component GldG [Kiritimatiella glycovorans]